jgi:nicotinamidase-related amidase
MYSAIEAEVPIPSDPHTQTNFEFVGDLKRAEKLIIGGQALSHCVNYTTRDLLRYWTPRDPADLILLLDGTLLLTSATYMSL